jgi:hypothetical protein
MNNSYQPFLPVTMRLKAGTVFIYNVSRPVSGGTFGFDPDRSVDPVRSGATPGIGATR